MLWFPKHKDHLCYHAVWIFSFHHPWLKICGSHAWMVCLGMFSVFVSITQFSDFLVMSYGNWKHILGLFKLWKHSYDGILVNIHTLRDPRSEVQPQLLTFFFFFIGFGEVVFFFFFFYFYFLFFLSHVLFLLPLFFSLSRC